ncbi:MAG: endonuclease/exonuclease/phosphatase family protein [Chitinophagales bacterium]|nr:endonuclease/exonuclease/phosphatase family protein [Chitinophagales bacterium]
MNKNSFLILNILLAIVQIGIYYISKIPPEQFWPGAFLSFAFPYVTIFNAIFILGWLMSKRLFSLISLFSIIITLPDITSSFSLPVKQTEGKFQILSYNVKNFDLYNWSRNKDSREKMLEIIRTENPDMICFQEFFTNEKDEFDNIKKIHEEFGYKYFHYEESTQYQKNHWGSATFSKFPIVERGKIDFDGEFKNMSIYTDVKIQNEVLRIYNLHLQSYHMIDEDYDFLKAISDFKIPESGSLISIFRKMRSGFVKRSKQAAIIKSHIDEYEGKKIVCGDFNDIPISYTYKLISKDMKDSYRFRGLGMGKTFVSSLPSLRIDYILVDNSIEVEEYRKLPYRYSDHYPISISFSF